MNEKKNDDILLINVVVHATDHVFHCQPPGRRGGGVACGTLHRVITWVTCV